jgi:hypothetical protein
MSLDSRCKSHSSRLVTRQELCRAWKQRSSIPTYQGISAQLPWRSLRQMFLSSRLWRKGLLNLRRHTYMLISRITTCLLNILGFQTEHIRIFKRSISNIKMTNILVLKKVVFSPPVGSDRVSASLYILINLFDLETCLYNSIHFSSYTFLPWRKR